MTSTHTPGTPTERSRLVDQRHRRLYSGHRSKSFYASDVNELVELRARQRTFDGAYSRTAMGNLGYALTILRLFDRRFYKIGVLYTASAGMIFVIAFIRQRHSRHDFADKYKNPAACGSAIKTVGQTGKRVFGRPFVTAGWIVALLSLVVFAVEVSLLVLIFRL
ncbi:hypothetical protein BD309DRAFT_973852 [Dichomitus squalens]|uniref:DUF202 domain-containing protein n=2 Tax=Dichomitus squalens TaxID=114155 RepID=A0A4Q9NDX7_9APHY|nr:uncharacterized protein DICSQDRAFT_155918 [Dichomitus squalens LYAD-421 SS1]EJF60169.1 hypothetical protein DICSQDRAFT_155918 [Dichomitus squalens LYAD-421 SS1]TBU30995.1 hypothetical protein BD311DRAFT_657673 [Dichomitus squalens]TBU37551.1 hypothetical protein BD309DRAFT_973852 [Dichomitus squalens]TBU51729.1 hypothetical protein BD310DRAFT_317591 [Dichomitus squalens]